MKKRLLSLLLALVMLVGMIPATSLPAFAAKELFSRSVTGIEVTGDGYYIDPSTNTYHLDDTDVSMISGTSKIDPDNYNFFSIYTDESCTTRLKTEPKLDETYYFGVSVLKADTTNNITNSNSNIKISGFYDGKVLSTENTDGGRFYCVCSVTYGELTGGVKAVASGVEYDSAKGGYAPAFTTLKAVSTEGKELEPVTIPSGNYEYSYYGVRVGPLYKTNNTTSFSDMLTTEPQEGETYYSYFRLDSIDGNLNIEEDLVDIQIPGYEVEYLASYERDMGFTSLVVYSVTKKAEPEVYVGGVGMFSGDYLAVGATKTQTTKPSGGYAYYKDGKLTLNNYSYEGKGYLYNSSKGDCAVIYSENDLTLELIGNNTLTQTESNSDMIYVDGANLTVGGDGKLTGTSGGFALYADKGITINGGTVEVSTYYTCISSGGNVIINDGDITAESENGVAIYSSYDVTINGGNVTATGGIGAILYYSSYGITVAEGMKIQASTTVDGELGEYVAANNNSYEKIVITTPDVYVGGVAMYDGDYLAVGATKTQTTKPSGGYAYYKDGKLTLNNYSYEGKGYQYNSRLHFYAVIYSKNDLTLELIGNNTLNQTYSESDMIYVSGANLTVGGDGKLTGTAGGFALYADKDITINGGTVEVSTYYSCIRSWGDVIINDGDITAESENYAAIFSDYDVTVNGGNVTVTGGNMAISCATDGFSVAEGMNIQASTTADGELGEYVSANRDSYKKITIHSHNFGTAWKYKEADGHAHVCSFCGEYDTVIKHTPDISAPTENQAQKCTVCGYVIAPSLGHIHKNHLTKVTAKPATCTSDGNSEYYSCSCGKYFKDASASTEIKDKDSVIIKASHSFGTDWGYQDENGHAHACVCGAHDELIPHTPGAEATETTPQKCTVCGYVIAPSLGHIHKNNLTKVTAKPATCTSDGNSEYYSCSCGKYFKDASAASEITDLNSVVIKAAHKFGTEWDYKGEDGHAHVCSCGAKDEILAHTPNITAPTETEDQVCTTCGYVIASKTGPVDPPVTDTTTPPTTGDTTTEPSHGGDDNKEDTKPDTTPSEKDDEQKQEGMPWWSILLIAVAAAGIGVAVTILVLKKKK